MHVYSEVVVFTKSLNGNADINTLMEGTDRVYSNLRLKIPLLLRVREQLLLSRGNRTS